jgi:hypothetical protein
METMYLLSENQMKKPQMNDVLLRKERPETMEIISLDNLAAQTLRRHDLSAWAKAELLANNLQRFLLLKPQGFPEENPVPFAHERERERQDEEARRDETYGKVLEKEWEAEQGELSAFKTSRIVTPRSSYRERPSTQHRSRPTTAEQQQRAHRRSRAVSPRQSQRKTGLLGDYEGSPLVRLKSVSPSPKRTKKQILSRPPKVGNLIPPSRAVKKLSESLEKAREDANVGDVAGPSGVVDYAQAFGKRGHGKMARSPIQDGRGWIVI